MRKDDDMTTFEYLAIAYSLLFSATALRIIGGLPHVLRRDRLYWVHAVHAIVLLCSTVLSFWVFLAFRDVDWTLPRFIGMLSIQGTLYFISSMAIPDDPHLVGSWEEHYFHSCRIRRSESAPPTATAIMPSSTDFGEEDPREMPSHFFHGSLRLDYGSAVRAYTDRQNHGVLPRY